jgi:CheY-like chemotaxis protein
MDKKKVMLVDDEIDYLCITKLNLEATGKFEVLTVSNPTDVMENLHSFKPDIILLDILMPAMDGIGVCEMLNKDSLGKRIPIIIVSALDTDKDRLDAYKAGIVDYLTKPAEIMVIIEKIKKALQFK